MRASLGFGMAMAAGLSILSGRPVLAQLNQNCTVSVLNRTVTVNPDGSWVLPNIPANFGKVKARATCVQNGVTTFGESDFFSVPPNEAVNLPAIKLGTATPIPASLSIAAVSNLTTAGQTAQLAVTATYPDGSTKDVTRSASGTNYTISNPAIATITADGLITAVSSGAVVLQANNDGATGITKIQVALGGSTSCGLPISWILQYHLNPNDPLVCMEDPDRDGLTNLQEYQSQYHTDPTNPDTDGDGLSDGDEVNKYHTNPLLADTDSDLIPDGVEVQTGTNPMDRGSYDLKKAAAVSTVTPSTFTLSTSQTNGEVSVQLNWKVKLIDGKTILDLTKDSRTQYTPSDLNVCSVREQKGLIFAGNPGICVITISLGTLSTTVTGTVTSFSPTALSWIAIPGFANAVKVSGNYAYIAAGSAGLQIVDVSDRVNPKIISSLATSDNANELRIVGNTVYLATSAGLTIIDIADSLKPVILGSIKTPDVAWDIHVSGNLAFVADGSAGLQIVNVGDRAAPSLVGSLAIPNGIAKGIDVSGSTAVIAASSAGVVIADVANPSSPKLLGSTSTPGDARKVAITGSAALIADYPESMQVVDFTNPAAPVIVAKTSDDLGGKLQDVTVLTVADRIFSFGADVFFRNGVPIVDVTQPNSPVPVAILDFSQYRDDQGHGIDADAAYVYLTAEEGTTSDLGTNGDTRLYIGQYRQIVDTFGIPPKVTITSPASGTTLIQGQTLTFEATATDDVAVASVNLLVDGQTVYTTSATPYRFTYMVPNSATMLTFGATASDYGNNVGVAKNLQLPVIPDPLTTAKGRVIDAKANPVSGATVKAFGLTAKTGVNGTFLLPGLPTIRGPITVTSLATVNGIVVSGVSEATPPITGGTTDVGDIQLFPKPLITSIKQKAVLANTTVQHFTVNGANLLNATFSVLPTSNPPPIAFTVASVDPSGSSAVLTLNIAPNVSGTFVLLARSAAGTSDSTPSAANTITIYNLDPDADKDGDGLSNAQEVTIGADPTNPDSDGDGFVDGLEVLLNSDPLNARSVPVLPKLTEAESTTFAVLNAAVAGTTVRETESLTFSVLNGSVVGTGLGETESQPFSVLNEAVTGTGIRETETLTFSVLNGAVRGTGITETESINFSILNGAVTGTGVHESESLSFSVLNGAVAGSGIAETESPTFSVLNGAVSGDGVHETESTTFSVKNGAGLTAIPTSAEVGRPHPGNKTPGPAKEPSGSNDATKAPSGEESNSIGNPGIDSDRDGLPDWMERLIGTDPFNPDTDRDGITDGEEVLIYHTDPLKFDTDGDGYGDGEEIKAGSDPLDPLSTPAEPHDATSPRASNSYKTASFTHTSLQDFELGGTNVKQSQQSKTSRTMGRDFVRMYGGWAVRLFGYWRKVTSPESAF